MIKQNVKGVCGASQSRDTWNSRSRQLLASSQNVTGPSFVRRTSI